MSDSGLPTHGAMVVGMLGGKLHDFEDLGLPFQKDVIPALEALGFPNEDPATVERAYPDLPAFPPQSVQATFLLEGVLIGLGVYVGKKLADPTIDALGKQIYEQVVQPALDRMWSRRRRQNTARPITAQFDHWFEGSKVLVRVIIRSDGAAETPDSAMVPAALRSAAEWLQRNPVTHRVLTYEVEEGKLPDRPKLTEPV